MSGEVVYFDGEGNPITPEQAREAQARRAMAHEAFGRDFRRMIFDELDEDQMGTLRHLFRMLGRQEHPADVVAWYEGMIEGACHARNRAAELGALAAPTRDCHAFQADAEDPETFTACTASFEAMICGKDRGADPHLAWDAGSGLG